MRKLYSLAIAGIFALSGCIFKPNDTITKDEVSKDKKMIYHMPMEDKLHEGTWLIWPHKYTYGAEYQQEIEDIWVQMVKALHIGEKVHIIAYNKLEQMQIQQTLIDAKVNMKQIDFLIAKSNDVWARDTGPIFVLDENSKPVIADFKFDGWGNKAPHKKDNKIPQEVAKQKNIPRIKIDSLVLEGGSIEIDGNNTLMATLSSVFSKNRNSTLDIKQVEQYLTKFLGIRNFIWLDGVIDEDITDAHIDGIARFLNNETILTVSKNDFANLYENMNMNDYKKLQYAKNIDGKPYKLQEVPLTKEFVSGTDFFGSYLNYYVGNQVVLLPIYEDDNDEIALKIIKDLYPERKVVPIVVNDLVKYGGMLHCVTQQQPQ